MLENDQFLNLLREWAEVSMRHSMHAFIRHNRESGFSLSQINTLFRLYHHGQCGVNDLADHLGVTKAAVSQLLDHLVDAGLLLRSEDPHDRRSKQIVLTEKGSQTVKMTMRARHAWVDDLALTLSAGEKEYILPALSSLVEKSRQLLDDHPCQYQHPKG